MFEQDGRLVAKGIGQPGLAATLTGPDRIEIAQASAVFEFERDATDAS